MDALENIMTRRSIRSFRHETVPEEKMNKLLEAAMNAPSAGNEQPWHFLVITERHLLDLIPRHHPYSHMLHDAPAAILICGDEELEKHEGYWVQDCAAATENLLLAAHAEGLGAVWLGVYPVAERVAALRKLLAIPPQVIPFSLIALGFAAEYIPPVARFSAARVHRNVW